MAISPGYAAVPRIGVGQVTTGDASRTAPTTKAVVFPAGASGSRIERLAFEAVGTTVASSLRLFLMQGVPGVAISTITFVTTTATVTTATPHGLKTGDLITLWGAAPTQYNVNQVAITVTSTTVFTYVVTTPPVNAITVGQFSTTPATPVMSLWQEIPFPAVTPSTSVAPYNGTLEAVTTPQSMPQLLPPGWALVATVNDTQTSSGINVIANGGDF